MSRASDKAPAPLGAGATAPEFALPAAPGQNVSLRDFRGRPVILAFYPADFSPVCEDQLSFYNECLGEFAEYGAALLAISCDGPWCHAVFAKARKLEFPLLSDFEPKGAVARKYGAYDAALGVCLRALFVIDRQGTVRWSHLSPMEVNPGADGILRALDELRDAERA